MFENEWQIFEKEDQQGTTMNISEISENASLSTKFYKARNQQLCPECGGLMHETNRSEENGAIFVWYKCSREECFGQWLQKMARAV